MTSRNLQMSSVCLKDCILRIRYVTSREDIILSVSGHCSIPKVKRYSHGYFPRGSLDAQL